MNWGSFENFVAMGGYGGFVWGAYGVTVLVIAIELVLVRARQRQALREAARLLAATERASQAAKEQG